MGRAHKLLAGTALAATLGAPAVAEPIYGLTNLQQLVVFDSVTRAVTSTTSLQGFSIGGEIAVGIDVRPATGELYAISSANNLYTINPFDGSRAQVGGTITPAPAGSFKSIDFNPTVDRVRLVTSGGTNLRLNPVTGAIAATDTPLAFAAGDPNAGDTPAVVNAAYTNSLPGTVTSTTLYDIDAFNNVLATQAPPNDGTLNTVGAGLGFDIASSGGFTGFDISGPSGTAYLVGNNLTGGLAVNTLYTVNLGTGAAAAAGAVSGINGSFRDITVVPEPSVVGATGIGALGLLARRRRGNGESGAER